VLRTSGPKAAGGRYDRESLAADYAFFTIDLTGGLAERPRRDGVTPSNLQLVSCDVLRGFLATRPYAGEASVAWAALAHGLRYGWQLAMRAGKSLSRHEGWSCKVRSAGFDFSLAAEHHPKRQEGVSSAASEECDNGVVSKGHWVYALLHSLTVCVEDDARAWGSQNQRQRIFRTRVHLEIEVASRKLAVQLVLWHEALEEAWLLLSA